MSNSASPVDDKTYERRERVLHAYYERLDQIDKGNRDLTNFFFAVNSAILAVVFQMVKNDWQRLILSLVGYAASVALMLINYKSFWAWKAYAGEVKQLEDELEYGISRKYEGRLQGTPAQTVRATLIRMRFNFLFVVLWLAVIVYLVYTIPAPWPLLSPSLVFLLGVLIVVGLVYLPWIYFTGTIRFGVIWATLHALWAREV